MSPLCAAGEIGFADEFRAGVRLPERRGETANGIDEQRWLAHCRQPSRQRGENVSFGNLLDFSEPGERRASAVHRTFERILDGIAILPDDRIEQAGTRRRHRF